MYTNQQTFDMVAVHLLTQNRRSESGEGTCMYRGDDGMKCAIGALIPDDKYKRSMEGLTANYGLISEALRELGHDPDFCVDLQHVHDSSAPCHWPLLLKRFAKDWNLNFAKAQEVLDAKAKASNGH